MERLFSLVFALTLWFRLALPAPAADEPANLDDLVGPADEQVAALALEAEAGQAETRFEAIWRLAQHAKGVPALTALLGRAAQDARPHVIIALGWQGAAAKSAAPAVAAHLSSKDLFACTAAVWALGRLGDATQQPRLAPLAHDEHELVRFLVAEATARLAGRELLAAEPLRRPLAKATFLHLSDLDAKGSAFLFGDALADCDASWRAVTVRPFNPSWSGAGGMPPAEEEACSRLLAFAAAGTPQVDAVLISALYPGELSFRLRWELWHYVRRGGKLLVSSILLQPMVGQGRTPSYRTIKFDYTWKRTIFDTLLPDRIARGPAPWLDGVPPPAATRAFGERVYGRGQVVLFDMYREPGEGGRPAATLGELTQRAHQVWRHLMRERGIGGPKALDPLMWRQLFTWVLEGPAAFPAGVTPVGTPTLVAGAPTPLALDVRNYTREAPHLGLQVTLAAPDGVTLAAGRVAVTVARGETKRVTVPLAVPLALPGETGELRLTLADAGGALVREERLPVRLAPLVKLSLTAPPTFAAGAEAVPLTVKLTVAAGGLPRALALAAAITDRDGRPLLRDAAMWQAAAGAEREFPFRLAAGWLPPGGYWTTATATLDGQPIASARQFLAQPAPWRGRDRLVAVPWGTDRPRAAWDALRPLGLDGEALPADDLPAWVTNSPRVIPYGQWRAGIIAGPAGKELREQGTLFARNPFFTALDLVEETDLEVGSAVFGLGDVELAGHEQYRIWLKQK